ncbi:unnamed protein product [Phytophthora lilii]|uniref:Unnamed protein product n=1 Tax=Phytophthora lilii TaxID=2077276 RepID=A0A9W6X7G9_9STRA|nr:unnamed protein product [Phytophthora lilii]
MLPGVSVSGGGAGRLHGGQIKKVRYLIELEWWEKSTCQNAARLIQAAWRAGHLRPSSSIGDQRHLYSLMRMARSLRMERPALEMSIEDQVAEIEGAVLAEVGRSEAQKVDILKRIQSKVVQVATLKEKLGMKHKFHAAD